MNSDFQTILQALRQKAEGLSASDLLLRVKMERRTLLRRLRLLIEKGQVARIGQGNQVMYTLPPHASEAKPLGHSRALLELSSIAKEIQTSINKPLDKRKPIIYQPLFLENYQPNHSFYLSQKERDYLHQLGAQEDKHQPAGTFARRILDRFLIDLSWNSSRLEGNSYSLLETEELIRKGKILEEKPSIETQMILNHKAAIEFLVSPDYEIGLDKFTICNLHALLSDNLLQNYEACGRVRKIAVGIGGSVYRPLDNSYQLEEFLQLILKKGSKIKNAFEQAFFLMVQLPYLQPFEDVNKRVSRLAANIPFINHNYCPISFVDVPQKTYIEGLLGIYELNRVELLKEVFLWAYERSTHRYAEIRQTIGEPDPFHFRYRIFARELIHEIIKKSLSKSDAIKNIRSYSEEKISKEDRAHFIEIVETELLALHEGSFARYKVTPNEFKAWKIKWLR